MPHAFDRGYVDEPFASLVADHPGPDVYPPSDFRVEWGPVFHRGRLDGSARVLVIGQDPGAHECVARRILVGEAGQRVQGFLARLGIATRYAMVNAFLYSVYGQGAARRHERTAAIVAYRNAWLDALFGHGGIDAVVAFGGAADAAFRAWRETASGQAAVEYRHLTHPTFPESASAAGQLPKREAMRRLLAGWNDALEALRPVVRREFDPGTELYGEQLDHERDLAPIPEADLPPGLPAWMREREAWAVRRGDDADDKRATLVVTVPRRARPWLEH